MIHRYYLLLLITFTGFSRLLAQYPQHIRYDDENGLPSNEVYCIVQDQRGFIWFGCDAGLYRFDGIRYLSYKCKTQKSKAFSGLTVSESGRIYCYNFQDQLFYVENDRLYEIPHNLERVSTLAVVDDQLYVTHTGGLSVYNGKLRKWGRVPGVANFTRSVVVDSKKRLHFSTQIGLGILENEKVRNLPLPEKIQMVSSTFLVEVHQKETWLISRIDNRIFRFDGKQFKDASSFQKLSEALEGRKVTSVESLKDGSLWIATYNGIIRYNTLTDHVEIFYPETAFSNVMIDREGNYWFTTLQSGILRVPDLEYLTWNTSGGMLPNEKLTHVATDGKSIFFSSVSRYVSQLDISRQELQTFNLGNNADFENFNYDPLDQSLFFSSNVTLYSLKNKEIRKVNIHSTTVKDMLHIPGCYFFSSSQGFYLSDSKEEEKLLEVWSREIIYDSTQNRVWVATNDGLCCFSRKKSGWKQIHRLFEGSQILSLTIDPVSHVLYALSFDGTIYRVDSNNRPKHLFTIPDQVQATKVLYHSGYLYLATNSGLWIRDLKKARFRRLNRMFGLASDNVQDLLVLNGALWLATGKGLQKIPVRENMDVPLAQVYLKQAKKTHQLHYGQLLELLPEASIYSANGHFEYAYRVNESEWIKLPASIENMEIQNLPSGNFWVEIKVIDHLGRDSENTIRVMGYVYPPFWQTWWFILLLAVTLILLVALVAQRIIRNIRKREREKNELLHSQLKAIRAQMNPHFMYNTLNSIQDLILQHDIKSTNYYLSRFSQLMRQILAFSEEERILLSEETEMLHNYLELEKLRFGEAFTFLIIMDSALDPQRTYIPSLIVQPFVENAIKHGLLHKKGLKRLKVSFTQNENVLEIVIEDNGVGRRRSAEIKERSGFPHKSFASGALHKRLELLNSGGKQQIEIRIEDCWESETDSGTRVCILIRS